MTKNKASAIHTAVLRLLRPLVSLLIKNGMAYKTFADMAKWVFYDVAKRQYLIAGRKQTQSRIAVLTGLARKDVKHLAAQSSPVQHDQNERYNRGARIISGWLRDKRYLDKRGRPRSIAIANGEVSFDSLVKRYGGDVPTRAVLDELARIGLLKATSKNRVRLIKDAFLPDADKDLKFDILGSDVALLIETIAYNLDPDTTEPFFQRKVSYNNLPGEALPRIRRIAAEKSNQLLNIMDKYIGSKDRDINPAVKGLGRYEAGLGVYYFEKPVKAFDDTD